MSVVLTQHLTEDRMFANAAQIFYAILPNCIWQMASYFIIRFLCIGTAWTLWCETAYWLFCIRISCPIKTLFVGRHQIFNVITTTAPTTTTAATTPTISAGFTLRGLSTFFAELAPAEYCGIFCCTEDAVGASIF